MSFPRYEKYKDSGVEWLGEVPEHWVFKRLSYFFDQRREKVSDKDFEPLSVTKNGVLPQLENAAKTDDGDNRKKVCKGDFVINSRSDRKGSSGLAMQDGSVSLINTVLVPSAEIDAKFTHHLLRSVPFQEEFYRYGKGIVADLWSTNFSEMKNIALAVPTISEQQIIATFLDRETAKIDALIAEQQRLIELLKEKRQALISHAVTKGLNPDAPMKDSGIEWLGEVPEDWVVSALKRQCSLLKDGTHMPPPRVENGIPLLSVRNIQDGEFGFRDDDSMISEENYHALCKSFIPQPNDVLLAIVGATLGKTALVSSELGRFHIQRSVAIFRPSTKMRPKWLNFLFRSQQFQQLLWEHVGYSAQPGIYLGTLAEFRISLPPLSEQDSITIYLDQEICKLDTLTTEAQHAIELLKERRSALISAAVTGKIDVRHALNLTETSAA